MTYNGWTNYETWVVALWLDNDEPTYRHWRERADEWRNADTTSDYWTQEESARFNLADELRESVNESNPLADDANMYTDLLGAALSEVDWQEIAEHMLDE